MRSARLPERLRRFALPFLCAVFVAAPAAVAADTLLSPYSATYKVKIRILGGELTTRLSRTDDGYLAVHRVAPTGFARALVNGTIEETSLFVLDQDGVRPLRYTSNDTVSGDKDKADFLFDWSAHSIAGDLNGQAVETTFEGEAHDRVSIQYAMMRDMLAGKTGRDYVLFDIDEFKTLEITLLDEREVDVPAGHYDAVGVRHQARGSSRVTTLWCVPELEYLPVIIEQHRKGKLNLRAELATYEKLDTSR